MNKKTIFLLPLDLKGKKQTRITPKFIRDVYNTDKVEVLPEHLQKKKKNIFTVELNRLIGKISEKNKNPEAKKETQALEEIEIPVLPTVENPIEAIVIASTPPVESIHAANDSLPEDQNSFEFLNKIYADENAVENADLFLKSLFEKLGIKAYSLFFYEPHTFTYYPIFANGLTEKTKTNLLFQSHDKFLQNRQEGYIHLYFQPVLVNDIFFKKKLSPVEFTNFSSLLLKFLDSHNLSGLISIFFEKDANPSPDEIELLSKSIDKNIGNLIPFLNSHFESQKNARLDSFDFLRKIIHGIHIQAKNFEGEFYFTKIKITNFLEVEDAEAKKKSLVLMLKNHLLEKEGIINISHNETILLTKENEVGKILNYLSENAKTDFQFQVNALKYPDNGKNLYLYF
jgi:hypothetical protein